MTAGAAAADALTLLQPPAPGGPGDAWLVTRRLVLRRPSDTDLEDYLRLHGDPRTYAHAPHTMPSPERCRERLQGDLDSWEADGVGYAAVVERSSGEVIGWAGLRVKDSDDTELNLYYRLAHSRLGQGLGREITRGIVAWGVEHRSERVTAMVDRVNGASVATATAAGLVQTGTRLNRDDPPDSEPMLYFEAPVVAAVDPADVDADLTDAVVDLWGRVNDAGGSVGFLPGAPRAAVAAALDRHLADVGAGISVLCTLRDPDGALRGLGFWEHSRGFPYEHLAGLKRLMIDPVAQGRNLGRVLLGGMVGIARRSLPAVELLRLEYRDGLGLGEFYASAGWTEVGRVPGGLKLSDTDYRDDVTMVRRLDGAPLT
ncbi:GNAT family N-acetyltransferase [Intrasporangium sp. YIM S08009]|uniref:GNAT family N-acetyltransferase n=1 Tax=Intrasporangium zincisolvens TaxID=3080018 RepID=UPI002B055F13|nr:GNAT family N-acetyltransferase [Intrasporangium sp. YIM S08009]